MGRHCPPLGNGTHTRHAPRKQKETVKYLRISYRLSSPNYRPTDMCRLGNSWKYRNTADCPHRSCKSYCPIRQSMDRNQWDTWLYSLQSTVFRQHHTSCRFGFPNCPPRGNFQLDKQLQRRTHQGRQERRQPTKVSWPPPAMVVIASVCTLTVAGNHRGIFHPLDVSASPFS